jgi:catechol 2,3-dioxygenase-like lactoylglutathione lyase family enzyme
MPVTIDRLDHLVLTVADLDATCQFYERVLGMERRTFGDARTALYFGRQKLNLHEVARPIDPNVRHAKPGSADLCFITETPMAEVTKHLAAEGVSLITGPGERSGATGQLMSVYVYDPDENLVEIANLLP